MREKRGKGYDGKSMSVNARIAYLDDEMPKSKWTKKVILQYLYEQERDDLVAKAQGLPLYVLREYLQNQGYHHTGKFYNTTQFYKFNTEWFEDATDDYLQGIIDAHKAKNPPKTAEEREAEKRAKDARIEAKAKRIEREKLFRYSSYKTLGGFLRNATPELEEQLAAKRQALINEKREQLREVWTKQGHQRGLDEIDNDDFIERYI